MPFVRFAGRWLLPALLVALVACSNGRGSLDDQGSESATAPPQTQPAQAAFTIGGTVAGLTGSGLAVQLNGANDLTILGNGAFSFPQALTDGTAYTVSIKVQPARPTQQCTLTNDTGTLAGANVSNVAINCVTQSFTVGGSVSGLAGTGLVLRLNGGNDLPIASNGAFNFSPTLLSGTSYEVSVRANPTGPSQICTVANGAGVVGGVNVNEASVSCATQTFAVRGQVSGLAGSGLTLLLNKGTPLAVSANGSFEFPTKVSSGSTYEVSVGTPPSNPTQSCALTNNTGTIGQLDITNIVVTCTTTAFSVGGTIANLAGSGFILANNGEQLSVTSNGAFAFPTPVLSGAAYSVSVVQQPAAPAQQCTIADGSGDGAGTVTTGPVTDVAVTCVTIGYTIGGQVGELRGAGLILQNNGGDDLPIAANGPFTFPRTLLPGQAYNVTIAQQPAGQLCLLQDPSGTVPEGNVTSVRVGCIGGGTGGL